MATLTVQAISRSGLNPSFQAAAGGGDQFANAGNVFHVVKNGDAGPHVVTYVTQKTEDGLAVTDRTVTVPAGEERWTGPFPKETYNDATGNSQVTYDGVTSVTVAAVSLTPVS
ncbi:MAG: hypothetical protein JXB07_18905 [Anaerolineae bacterium]|nr:hypothetical protein [Anaerolineae bacterium]